MVKTIGCALLVLLSTAVVRAETSPRVEYGKRSDLRGVARIVLVSEGNVEVANEAKRLLSALLPGIAFADEESADDVTLTLVRKLEPPKDEPSARDVVTLVRATRERKRAIHLYFDATSKHEDVAAAVAETVTPFAALLREQNPERFGSPEGDGPRRAVHSTEGLRPGMSKRDVYRAIGRPLKVDRGHAFTETWTYETTDGTMRLVFGGDRLASIAFDRKK